MLTPPSILVWPMSHPDFVLESQDLGGTSNGRVVDHPAYLLFPALNECHDTYRRAYWVSEAG